MKNYTEQQYEEFVSNLEAKYPKMFGEPYGGVAVGAGWRPVISNLCANIQHYLNWKNRTSEQVPQVVVTQIKEKFGGLRFYYDGGDEHIAGMVTMAEAWAGNTCETCGKPGEQRSGGWIRTLCDEHEAEYQAKKILNNH